MGDSGYNIQQLSMESFRLDTYDTNTLSDLKIQLARAGFYYTRNALKVKCFVCYYELDAGEIGPTVDIASLHKEKRPDCRFADKLEPGMSNARSKRFLAYDSLRYEKERLETFIEWPVPWLNPDDLSADGFYYLRTSDHCACVYCRGVVGGWEPGDTPRGEHQRHFPHCPFIRGQPVGNVPLNHSSILDKLPLDEEECPLPPPRWCYTTEVAGSGASATAGRHVPGPYPEYSDPNNKNNVNFDAIGLPRYSGPKRKDYITRESRVKSFTKWPERVIQKPEEMANAGFFYCGLSDHVRCFHCGSGLRNWEFEDNPWDEHARWYPDCNYVVLSKGQEFIDKVRRERPLYQRSAASKDNKPRKVSASSGRFKSISDVDLEPLMDSDIIQAVTVMGLPQPNIRRALRQKLEQTGMPFFCLESCIEAVLQIMEEETGRTMHESNEKVVDETTASQNDTMQVSLSESQNNATSAASSSSSHVTVAGPSDSGAVSGSVTAQSTTPATGQQSTAEKKKKKMKKKKKKKEADERIKASCELLKPTRSPSSPEVKGKDQKSAGNSIEGQPSNDVKKASVSTAQSSQKDIAEELEMIRESRTCKICMDAEMDVVFLPCTHMATCSSCAVTMGQCPLCRSDIKYTIKPIFS